MQRFNENDASVDRIINSLTKASNDAENCITKMLDLLDELTAIKGDAIAAGGALAQRLPSNLDANISLIKRLVGGLDGRSDGTFTAVVDENVQTSLYNLKEWVGSVPYSQLTSSSANQQSSANAYRQRLASRGMARPSSEVQRPQVNDAAFEADDGGMNESALGNQLDFNRLMEQGYGNNEPIENRIQESLNDCLSGSFNRVQEIPSRAAYDLSWTKMPLKGNDKWSTASDELNFGYGDNY